jgi:hypothetical protein
MTMARGFVYLAVVLDWFSRRVLSWCESACKKTPLFGVIGIQTGPRHRGPISASAVFGSRGWDAGRGDDCKDTPGVFQADKPIKTICRELDVSRKVVRKVIRSGATEFVTSGKVSHCRRLGAGATRLIGCCRRTRPSHHVNV